VWKKSKGHLVLDLQLILTKKGKTWVVHLGEGEKVFSEQVWGCLDIEFNRVLKTKYYGREKEQS